MMHTTHMLGGSTAWLGACLLAGAPPAVVVAGTAAAAITAPACDLDNLGAWSGRKKRGVKLTRRRSGYRVKVNLIRWRKHPVKSRVAYLASLLGEHRQGPLHSYPLALLVAAASVTGWALWSPWPWWLGVAAATGLASHITLDLLNRKPVRAWWPLPVQWGGFGFLAGGPFEVLVIRTALFCASGGLAWLAVTHG